MSKQKIVILGKIPPPYFGPAIATEILLNSVLNASFDLKHFDTRINTEASSIGRFSLKKPLKLFFLYRRFNKLLIDISPDLIVIPISQSTIGFIKDSIFILLAVRQKLKTILHLRGSNLRNILDHSGVLFQKYSYWILRKSSAVIVLGNKLKYIFQGIVSDDKIFVVPNGVNLKVPFRYYEAPLPVKILYLSNLQPAKGIIDVVKAIKILNGKQEQFSVSVYGSWRDMKTRQLSEKLVSSGKLPVIFNPPVHGPLKYKIFADADIFIFPPNEPEGHPWVIIEAMAAGLPIITTDQGAITESVLEGINGFIVGSHNPEQIADRILFLIENPEIRIKMGKESRRLYEENFTEEIMIRNLSNVFNTVLNS